MLTTVSLWQDSKKVTKLILQGSIAVCFLIVGLILYYEIVTLSQLSNGSALGFTAALYLVIAWYLYLQGRVKAIKWMLLLLYITISAATMLYWGINTAAGIFSTCFAIILTGILFGSRAIFPILLVIAAMLIAIQNVHRLAFVTPDTTALQTISSYFDVFIYITILGVFALITWVSNSQTEASFEHAKRAEQALRAQKESLAYELEKESIRLRDAQLKELQQLYKFAILGQSTAAALHELSNHLNVLTLDMDDLTQQNKKSATIANAQESIKQINAMVRDVRRNLDKLDGNKKTNVSAYIERYIKDHQQKNPHSAGKIEYLPNKLQSITIKGDPMALTQIISILITNSLEACSTIANPKVTVTLSKSKKWLTVTVSDNGPGITKELKPNIFKPSSSTKPNGLGIGLYIAKQLAKTHFKGDLKLHETDATKGACFKVTLPIYEA